ncbi:GntR family transcriptional regulator [Paenibacillus sp. IB182496]|uniref:GntR family transcriptional regulator n=1 Tax=Paenibacillus sabuli TaxID=2772509 RepID=A0A927GTB9_9BACL|nr:GntR family transcriptional regulator [Paenibacillus sabuli]
MKTVSIVGTFVNAIDEQALLDIMDTRLMLEFWVIERLPTVGREQREEPLARMTSILAQTSERIRTSAFDSNLHANANLAFHLEFIGLGGNEKNKTIYQALMDYRFLAAKNALISKEMVESAQQQHHAIVDAVREGEREPLRQAIETHLNDSKTRLLDNIKRSGGMI